VKTRKQPRATTTQGGHRVGVARYVDATGSFHTDSHGHGSVLDDG
jgi:hypothetical protein